MAAFPIGSVVLGPLLHPFPHDQNILPVQGATGIQACRHFKTLIGALKQFGKSAGFAVAGFDDGPELGALHQALVSAQIQSAFYIPFSARYVAIQAVIIDDRKDIILEANLSFSLSFKCFLLWCA